MFQDLGEYTLCSEFEVIEPTKDIEFEYPQFSDISDAPILLHVHDAFQPLSSVSSPCASSPCSSSPYSFLSAPSSHTSSLPRTHPRSPRTRTLFPTDFRPVRTLGKGGHGKVYLVQDVVSERYLAMKVIEKNGLRMREYPTVFEEQAVSHALVANGDEARLGSGGSPWLAPLLGSFEDSDNFYFLTEYYPGGDLMKVIKRQGVVPVHRARRWCAELLVALEHLHDQRIIHRDVKPENILIDENDHIALTDFGIARAFGTPDTERPWRHLNPWNTSQLPQCDDDDASFPTDADETCSLVGTPGYTAPEVYSGRYTYGADVWGAGVVLHTMLTGRLPFGLNPHEQRLEELIMRTDTLPADYDLHGNVDREARDVLIQMLEKDPARRPSIGELKQHRWFRGVNWDTIQRRKPHEVSLPVRDVMEAEEDVHIPYGRPYNVFDKSPHEWFEWTSPILGGVEDSFDTTNEWSMASTCYTDFTYDDSLEPVSSGKRSKRPNVVQKMKGWWKRRMSLS